MKRVSVRIDEELVSAAINNPDLPASFIAESLKSIAESHEDSLPFVLRSAGTT